MSIKFFEEDVKLPKAFKKRPVQAIIKQIVSRETSKSIDYINYIFCSDEYLLGINKEYLQHDYYTDIITFDYDENILSSDIFVSLERIIENAGKNSVTLLSELHRVINHGVLHLVGYKDSTPEQQKLMTEKEDFYLELMK